MSWIQKSSFLVPSKKKSTQVGFNTSVRMQQTITEQLNRFLFSTTMASFT